MNGLETALREAAERMTPAVAALPEELWAQGRRRVRRRRLAGAGALAAAAAIVAGFIVAGPPLVTPEAMPVAGTHDPALPRNVYDPPSWLASTKDEGPLGQLAVLGMLPGGDDLVPFGISATTGEYLRLDLPDRNPNTSVSLSPDGRHVAYWLEGKAQNATYPAEPTNDGPVAREIDHAVVGYAVYDTSTGEVVRHEVSSKYGIRPGGDGGDADWGAIWMSDSMLALHYGEAVGAGTTNNFVSVVWEPGQRSPEIVRRGFEPSHLVRTPDGTLLGWADNDADSEVQILDAELKKVGTSFFLPAGALNDVTRHGNGLVVARGYLGDGGFQRLLAGPVVEGGQPDFHEVTDLVIGRLHGWLSATEVLVSAWPASDDGAVGQPDLYRVDVKADRVTRLGAAGDDYDSIVAFTQDLLEQPMVEGPRPDFGPNPLFVRLGVAGFVLLGGVALLVWRRRARG